MNPRYDQRKEAQGQLANLTLRWMHRTRNGIKPKLFGSIYFRHNMPRGKRNLWVKVGYWRLKS